MQSTEEAKQALETAKQSDARKHKLLEVAAKYQKEADNLTHKKIATAEDVLSEKLQELTEVSKVYGKPIQIPLKSAQYSVCNPLVERRSPSNVRISSFSIHFLLCQITLACFVTACKDC